MRLERDGTFSQYSLIVKLPSGKEYILPWNKDHVSNLDVKYFVRNNTAHHLLYESLKAFLNGRRLEALAWLKEYEQLSDASDL